MKIKPIIISIWILIIIPTLTYGVFIDKETSSNNSFSATTLDTTLVPSQTLPIISNITNTQSVQFSSTLTNIGSLNTQNTLTVENITNTTFSSKIWLHVTLDDSTILYSGYLNSFINNSYLTQIPTQSNKISFTFSISETDYQATPKETISFNIVNHAWQTTLPYGNGFSDNETLEIQLTNTD